MTITSIYKLGYQLDRVTSFALVDQTAGFFNQFDGRALASAWSPPRVHPADTPDDDATLGDCTVLGTVPLLSQRAAAVLDEFLRDSAELLPVVYPRAPYFVLNVLGMADCLLEGASDLERFPTGRVMRVRRYVFDRARLPGTAIFRIPQLARAHIFVSDAFRVAVQAAALNGFNFELVWTA